MRGLDTNLLVRYLVADDPKQTQIVADLIASAEERNDRLFVGTIALCELVWTLRSVYRVGRQGITSAVEALLGSGVFAIQDRDLVRRALEHYRGGKADFSDYLLGEQDRKAGCIETLTFDRELKATAGFRVLGR
ncbi:MAG TPA: type II toxin-antitoxin system VapC family toxin [Thermoanaerobaculia bacterium]|nr:type II toxin-antitoxin system VapC family toxin [Thermoanaerobaculia bacterium]